MTPFFLQKVGGLFEGYRNLSYGVRYLIESFVGTVVVIAIMVGWQLL